MAVITNYTTLKTEIAAWISRADLTTAIPGLVQFAESRFNRTLRARQMETKAAFSITGEYVAAPAEFLEFRSGYTTTTPRTALAFMPSDTLTDSFSSEGTGRPQYFCVEGSNFRFGPIPDATYDATIVYYAAIPPLELNATNWLLLAHPDLYLYGALLQGEGYIMDDPRLPLIKAAYDEGVAQLNNDSRKARWGGNAMAARAA